jgi:transposase
MFISDAQWEVLKPVLDVPKRSVYGRPRANAREVFEAILFILHTGMQWKYLPKTFPPKSTVHDYLQFWSTQQAFRKLLALVIRQLVQKGRVDLQQCFVDATFAAAKGGGEGVGLTRKGKGTKIQLVVDAKGIPLAVSLDAADRAECHMVQQTLAWEETDAQPERLIGDKAYDSDALDDALAELGIEMISPHRRNRLPENQTQDGRPLRRYRHRWIVERTIAWLNRCRRLAKDWERLNRNALAFLRWASIRLMLRHLCQKTT